MKILYAFPLVLLAACSTVVSQQPSEEAKQEQEFKDLLSKAKAAQVVTAELIKQADKKSSEVIIKTSTKIVSLKQEVQALKTTLNETNNTPLIVDLGVDFELLPIGASQENR